MTHAIRATPHHALRRLLLASALALLLPSAANAQATHADRFAAVRDTVRAVMDRLALPSVAVAVARDGQILWEEGFGWADRERRIEATAHTPYSLASISKPITATALMTLVERGAVDLDRPVEDYLGGVKLSGLTGETRGATVRRVLSHTAGLPTHYAFFYEGDDPASFRETDVAIARYGILINPPGTVYEYSNLGYGIIERVIERAAGQDYADFLRTEVFLPLGMTRSSVFVGPGLEPFAAQRYDPAQRPIPFYDFDHRGGSAVYASAHDLVRFGLFHLEQRLPDQRRILADSTLARMRTSAAPDSSPSGYGLGWSVSQDYMGYLRVSHTGFMPGVATILALFPSERLAIAVVTNKADRRVYRIADDIAAAVLPELATALAEQRARPAPPPAAPAPFAPPAELLGEWTGTLRTYEGTVPFTLTFQPDGDVHVRLGDQLPTLLAGATFRNGVLAGAFKGVVPTADARRRDHVVRLGLRLRDGKLSGQALAQTPTEPVYFGLASYVELSRRETAAR